MKKIIYSFILVSLVVGQFACKKQLDLLPTDVIDASKAYTTVDDLERGLLGAYAANNQINKIFLASILSDEAKLSDENRGQGQFEFKWQYSSNSGGVTAAYRQYYTMIDRIHRVLAGFDNVTPANQAETEKMAKIKAELTGLKGVAYYESLINVMPPGYNPDALGLAIVNASCIDCTPARNTVGEVVQQIETLLAEARADAAIPDSPDDPLRLSKAAIAGYQSRVAMLKKDWTAAIGFATDAITLSGLSLATGSDFEEYWFDNNETESILKYRNQTAPRLLWRDSNGDMFFEPSDKLKALYDRDNDIRFAVYFTAVSNDTSVVDKYKGSSFGATINDLKIIRLAELYLNRAESYAHSNKLNEAATDFNTVQAARIVGYTPVSFASQGDAENAIINLRFKELCFEGFRYYDLKRNSLPITRFPSDVQSTLWQNLPANDYRYTLPVPQDAIDSNPNTRQNDGY